MVLEFLADSPIVRGVVLAALGVGFWAVGPLVAYLVWRRFRGPDDANAQR